MAGSGSSMTLESCNGYVDAVIACGSEEDSATGCSMIWRRVCRLCRSCGSSRSGSETSLIKNSLPSSVNASKRTLTSHDSVAAIIPATPSLVVEHQPTTASGRTCTVIASKEADAILVATGSLYGIGQVPNLGCGAETVSSTALSSQQQPAPAPSYLQLSRCVGGYSTFTSYAPERLVDTSSTTPPCLEKWTGGVGNSVQDGSTAVPPAGVDVCRTVRVANGSSPAVFTDIEPVVMVAMPKGGHHCRLTLVDDVVTDISILSDSLSHGGTGGSSLEPVAPLHNCYSNGITAAENGVVHGSVANGCSIPTKDGSYFLCLVDSEQHRLQELCHQTEHHLLMSEVAVSDEVEGRIRAAIGKANLLMSQKFRQFRELCHKNLCETNDAEPFPTTDGDLAGFWDMVLLQVADVDRLFDDINRLRLNNWQPEVTTTICGSESNTVVSPTSKTAATKGRSALRHGRTNQMTPPVKSTRSEQSIRSREEARSRLMAAKMAGRQRKASDSDKDVEIFVS